MLTYVVRQRDPWRRLKGLERDIDRVFRDTFPFHSACAPDRTAAAIEATRDADGTLVRVEVPGVDPAAINISVDGRTLTIAGERAPTRDADGKHWLRERTFGAFAHTVHLADDLDPEHVTADCRHGVLTVRIPKRPETKPRQIDVKIS